MTPSLYFIHIPKTAGTTFKTFLENYYSHGESLAIPDRVAEHLTAEVLNRYSLFCGHYSSDVLAALGAKPALKLVLLREPVDRYRSWTANCRRVNDDKFRELLAGRTDLEVVAGPKSHPCFQAYWLARALHGGAQYADLPSAEELPNLLDHVEIVGLTEELDRVMQLVAFRLGWPPPPCSWTINRSPGDAAASVRRQSAADDDQLRAHLALDGCLYDLAQRRFWADYAAMLRQIAPTDAPFTPEDAAAVPQTTVQEWLRSHYFERLRGHFTSKVSSTEITADAALRGEGWWWREVPGKFAYRWSGPGNTADLYVEPLSPGRDYELTVEFMGAADWPTWEDVAIHVNGIAVPRTLEHIEEHEPEAPSLRLRATVESAVVGKQDGMTRLTLRVPDAKPVHRHIMVLETFDTYNPDDRCKGVAVHRVRIEPSTLAADVPSPALAVHQCGATMTAENTLSAYLAEGYSKINGWLSMPAVDATLAIAAIQQDLSAIGPVCEIGVWQGRYLALLSFLADPPQRVVGIDPFVHVQDRDAQIARLHDNIRQYARHPDLVTILERDSRTLTANEILSAAGGRCQFVSVDGDHTMPGCLHDMHLAEAILAPWGVLAVDDICNMACPGVVEAAVRYGTKSGSALAPFLIAGNKLFMARTERCAFFREVILDRCRSGAMGDASAPIAQFAARMEALQVPVQFLEQPVLIHP